jgi:hypothetical protein
VGIFSVEHRAIKVLYEAYSFRLELRRLKPWGHIAILRHIEDRPLDDDVPPYGSTVH